MIGAIVFFAVLAICILVVVDLANAIDRRVRDLDAWMLRRDQEGAAREAREAAAAKEAAPKPETGSEP